jgi:hypothetical protein
VEMIPQQALKSLHVILPHGDAAILPELTG